MNDTLRLVFAGILAFSLLMLYKSWEETNTVALTSQESSSIEQLYQNDSFQSNSQTVDADLPVPSQSLSNNNNAIATDEAALPNVSSQATGKIIRVETDWFIAKIRENGGVLFDLRLKNHDLDGKPYPLLQDGERLYIAESGLLGQDGIANHKTPFKVVGGTTDFRLAEGANELQVILVADSNDLRVEKRYVFKRSSYSIGIIDTVKNDGETTQPLFSYYRLSHDTQTPVGYSAILPTFFGAGLYTENDKYQKFDFSDFEDATYPKKSNNGWIGIVQQYFSVVWLPPQGEREFFIQKNKNNTARVGFILPIGSVARGGEASVSVALFAGGQEQSILNELNESGVAPGIHLVVDYGWLTFIAVLLFAALQFIQTFVVNWGVAIILLTFTVKLIFYPLSSAAYRSMAKMKEEAPRIKKIQEQCGSDKQKMQKEMMALYKQKKINPLGGCLPILVQIPVFIALYWVLLGSIEIRHVPFFWWITDLSTPDPYFILSFIMGGSMFLQTMLSPAPPDPTQAMIMRIMPIGFAIFSVFFPSGLVLYWVVNTLLSITQQWYIARTIKLKAVAANKQ